MYATKEIIKEYIGVKVPSKLFLVKAFVQKLETIKKLIIKNRSYVKARVKRLENVKTFHYPTDNGDRKFVEVAIATKARYLISNDPDILDLLPNRYNGEQTDNITPSRYVEINSQLN